MPGDAPQPLEVVIVPAEESEPPDAGDETEPEEGSADPIAGLGRLIKGVASVVSDVASAASPDDDNSASQEDAEDDDDVEDSD